MLPCCDHGRSFISEEQPLKQYTGRMKLHPRPRPKDFGTVEVCISPSKHGVAVTFEQEPNSDSLLSDNPGPFFFAQFILL